ncbi:MAG: adenylyltransferase/cytidyltransferase family protein [Culicoidibacterales bacterium]
MKKVGVIFGKFFPVHLGHVYFIEMASQYVDELVVVMCSHQQRDYYLWERSQIQNQPTIGDRMIWLKAIFAKNPKIQLLHLHEENVPLYPFGWPEWSQAAQQLLTQCNVKPDVIFTNQIDDIDNFQFYFSSYVQLLDAKRVNMPISGTEIRQHLWRHWQAVPVVVRPKLQQKICIVGQDALEVAQQLARTFNTIVTNQEEPSEFIESPFVFTTDQHLAEQSVLRLAIERSAGIEPHLLVAREGAYGQLFKAIKKRF